MKSNEIESDQERDHDRGPSMCAHTLRDLRPPQESLQKRRKAELQSKSPPPLSLVRRGVIARFSFS